MNPSTPPFSPPAGTLPPAYGPLKRVEHYTLFMLNRLAAGGSPGLTDGDIDYAIDVAERLVKKLIERGHIAPHD